MRVRGIDREVGPVDPVAINLVDDADGAVVAGDVPLIGVRTRRGQRLPLAVEGLQLEDVLRVLVERISSRRRSAHASLEGRRRDARKGDLDLGVVVFRRGERHPIRDRRGLRDGVGRAAERDEGDHRNGAKYGHKAGIVAPLAKHI